MVLTSHCQLLRSGGWIARKAAGHRPAFESAVPFQAEVIMQPGRRMFLDHETQCLAGGDGALAAGLGGDGKVAHGLVFLEAFRSLDLGRGGFLRCLAGQFFFAVFFLAAMAVCSSDGNIVPFGGVSVPVFQGKSRWPPKKAAKKKAASTRSSHKPAGHRAAVVRGHHKPANSNEPHLSARPIWQGNLRLSLVSCPVALYSAASRASRCLTFICSTPRPTIASA